MSEDEFISSSERFIHSEGVFAGRNHSLEDKSSNPKSVYCPTVTPSHPELWTVEYLGPGRYKLYTRGAPVGTIDNLLYAFVTDQYKADEWVFKPQTSGTRKLYIIEKADGSGLGWVKSTNIEEPQVAVRPLISYPTEPPSFPPNQLWEFPFPPE